MTITYNIEISAGESNKIKFLWLDQSTNLPNDTTGYSAFMDVRQAPGADLIRRYMDIDGSIILGGSNGVVEVDIKAYDLTSYGPGNLWYDLLLVFPPTRETIKLSKGFVSLDSRITLLDNTEMIAKVSTTPNLTGTLK